jgi:hypothetical protein|tara:strand:+ start:887 stop:1333 length:447 start_codon:yes stop_codon:yes gene_type:complete
MIKDNLNTLGELRLVLRNEKGEVKKDITVPNIITTAGKTHIASRMEDASATAMSHMELGTGTTTPAAGDTTLETIVSGSRTALTSWTASTNTVTAACTFGASVGTGALTEAGVLNASSGGTLLAHTTFSVINKAAADSLTVSWTITIS